MPHTNRRSHVPASRTSQTALIRRFHAIEKELASLPDPSFPDAASDGRRAALLAERQALGGLEAYQHASVHGADKHRGGESSKWLVKQLVALPPDVVEWHGKPRRATYVRLRPSKIRLLDVGAIAGTAYLKWPWIDSTSIDLNAQHERVIKSDFFSFTLPAQDSDRFDIVCLSLVLNFMGSLQDRGRALVHAHSYLRDRGLLYIVLPLACVSNSRYLTHDRFESILRTTGWRIVSKHDSSKLHYVLAIQDFTQCDGREWRKDQVSPGIDRNNFAIIVTPELAQAVLERAHQASKDNLVAQQEWKGINVINTNS